MYRRNWRTDPKRHWYFLRTEDSATCSLTTQSMTIHILLVYPSTLNCLHSMFIRSEWQRPAPASTCWRRDVSCAQASSRGIHTPKRNGASALACGRSGPTAHRHPNSPSWWNAAGKDDGEERRNSDVHKDMTTFTRFCPSSPDKLRGIHRQRASLLITNWGHRSIAAIERWLDYSSETPNTAITTNHRLLKRALRERVLPPVCALKLISF